MYLELCKCESIDRKRGRKRLGRYFRLDVNHLLFPSVVLVLKNRIKLSVYLTLP